MTTTPDQAGRVPSPMKCPLCGNEIVRSGMSWHHVANGVRDCPPTSVGRVPSSDHVHGPDCDWLSGRDGENECLDGVSYERTRTPDEEQARLDNHYGYCTLPPDHDGPCAAVRVCSCGKPFPEDGGAEGVCECCSGCALREQVARAIAEAAGDGVFDRDEPDCTSDDEDRAYWLRLADAALAAQPVMPAKNEATR